MLSNGKGRPPLVFSLPNRFVGRSIRQVELLWRVDRYELALTVEAPAPPLPWADGQAAGIDLGEVNIAAIVSEDGHALVISGRYLRSIKRLRNKRHSTLSAKLARCRKGSRRWRRLKQRKAQASALFQRQQRDMLHKASRQIVQFSRQHNVNRIAIGDVRNIANHVDKGQKVNQKITQWAHGYLRGYIGYKSRAAGMSLHEQDEAYSTRTCCRCNCLLTSAPRGRVLRCPGCGFLTNRDANGGANICSRFVYGSYGRVQPTRITYQRPLAVVAPRTQARGSPPVAVRHEPPETSSSLGECHVHFTG
jgi:putative transposase